MSIAPFATVPIPPPPEPPQVTVTQDGPRVNVVGTLPPPQTFQLLLAGLLAVHEQLVRAQLGEARRIVVPGPVLVGG